MDVKAICELTKLAANKFAGVGTDVKNAVLNRAKELLFVEQEAILQANLKDIERAKENGRNAAFIDRLALTPARIKQMADGLDAIIALPDPVGEICEEYVLPNNLEVKRVRAPLGVIGIIFEARPNVSIDAAALCIKSGNGVILRGSRESVNSVGMLVACIKRALEENGISPDLVGLIESQDREATAEMLRENRYIDVVIPRGGEGLKKVVLANATMPVIASAGGNCHTYVAPSANLEMAIPVILNAKTSRPSTCNALETILIDEKLVASFAPVICSALEQAGVKVNGTDEINAVYANCNVVGEDEFSHEYDDMEIKITSVKGLDEAIAHINKYGTNHSDAILTEDVQEAEKFAKEVDSSAVYINTSTRFTDGFELGLGAEMGISTQKLHVRGPIGLKELTSVKYVVKGYGQLRK
ncbi:MAG: glutamate-5-semialdehyde dehydrogenase [Clostridia bacterium]|nr:glutamate-5-semialdehyde dehydrogenase [Clostridia bacterium]